MYTHHIRLQAKSKGAEDKAAEAAQQAADAMRRWAKDRDIAKKGGWEREK